jgi:hypothetical protein
MNGKIKNPRFRGKGKSARSFSGGGMLVGPSHNDGGIQALVDGTEPIEVEGGEFIINKQTVDAVGEDFLHKLNSTETTHHTGGFGEGQLPQPSQFKDGGKINGRNNMRRTKATPSTKPRMQNGGGVNQTMGRRAPQRRTRQVPKRTPRRMARGGVTRGRKMAHGGMHCGPGTGRSCGGRMENGGRVNPITTHRLNERRNINFNGTNNMSTYNTGGVTGGINRQCKMHTGKVDCNNTSGCTWNYSTSMCH